MSLLLREPDQPRCPLYGRFSNRPVGVKHFQAIHHGSVDVSRGLALLSGIGTRALPPWDPRTGRNNLPGGLPVRVTVPRKQAGHMTCPRPQAARQILLAMRASSTHDP